MDSVSFGKKLRMYRAQCGWSLAVCAAKIGITPRYLADIERGDKIPRLETLLLILNTLSASADDVLQDSLVVGYAAQSNDLLRKLDSLDVTRRRQALDIFDGVISSLRKN